MIELPDLPQPSQHGELREWAERLTVALRQYLELAQETFGQVDTSLGEIDVSLAGKVAKAGDTMTGSLATNTAVPLHRFHDTAGPVDKKQIAFAMESGFAGIHAYNDAGAWQRRLMAWPHGGGVMPSFYENGFVGFVDIVFPAGVLYAKVRGIWNPLTVGANLIVRTSHDGGVTFNAGATDYNVGYLDRNGTVLSTSGLVDQSFIWAGYALNSGEYMPFEVTVATGVGATFTAIMSDSIGFTGAGQVGQLWAAGFRKNTTPVNAMRLFCNTGSLRFIRYTTEFI